MDLRRIEAKVKNCTRCHLSGQCNSPVPGRGDAKANIMLVGEAPGYNEDQKNQPFVGRAGQILDELIDTAGIRDQGIYITNLVKCRPPQNRNPEGYEIEQCNIHLYNEVLSIVPSVIVSMGNFASHTILGVSLSMRDLRGSFYHTHFGSYLIPVLPTYHPAFYLRNPAKKDLGKTDFKLLKSTVMEYGSDRLQDQEI